MSRIFYIPIDGPAQQQSTGFAKVQAVVVLLAPDLMFYSVLPLVCEVPNLPQTRDADICINDDHGEWMQDKNLRVWTKGIFAKGVNRADQLPELGLCTSGMGPLPIYPLF
jgi:hypothetical protein